MPLLEGSNYSGTACSRRIHFPFPNFFQKILNPAWFFRCSVLTFAGAFEKRIKIIFGFSGFESPKLKFKFLSG